MTDWKVNMDPTGRHSYLCHLSHLTAIPLLAIATSNVPANVNLMKEQLMDAATTGSLTHQGDGTGWDADSGDSPQSLKAVTSQPRKSGVQPVGLRLGMQTSSIMNLM